MPMDGLAVDASHLARRFGRRWALADVSFQVQRGQVMMHMLSLEESVRFALEG